MPIGLGSAGSAIAAAVAQQHPPRMLGDPRLPIAASARVLARELDAEDGSCSIRIAVPVGDVPAVRLVSQSAALAVQSYEGLTVETIGGPGSQLGVFRLDRDRPKSIGRVRGFAGPFGVFVRSYAYMRSYGTDLRAMSETAVLNPNYVLAELKDD